MNAFLVGAAVCVVLLGFIGFGLGVVFLVYFLARNNIFFTIVEEGSAKAIMRGGEFHHFVLAYRGHSFDKQWNLNPLEEEERTNISGSRRLAKLFGGRGERFFGGIRWLGIPFLNTVYEYNFRWTVLRESEPSDDEEGLVKKSQMPNSRKWVVSFAKRLDYIYLRDAIYFNELLGAETAELMPVDIFMLVPMRVRNPYKALFRVHQWLDATLDLIKPSVRYWVAQTPYKEVVGKVEVAEHEFDRFLTLTSAQVLEITGESKSQKGPISISEYILGRYGILVKRVTFEDVVPPEEYSRAATKRVEAAQDAERAKAEKERIETLAQAEANRMQTVYGKVGELGETGLAVRMFESIDRAGEKQGNWVIPLGSVQNLLDSVLGRKRSSTEGENK